MYKKGIMQSAAFQESNPLLFLMDISNTKLRQTGCGVMLENNNFW